MPCSAFRLSIAISASLTLGAIWLKQPYYSNLHPFNKPLAPSTKPKNKVMTSFFICGNIFGRRIFKKNSCLDKNVSAPLQALEAVLQKLLTREVPKFLLDCRCNFWKGKRPVKETLSVTFERFLKGLQNCLLPQKLIWNGFLPSYCFLRLNY